MWINRADNLCGFDIHNGTTWSNWDSRIGTQNHVGVDADNKLPFWFYSPKIKKYGFWGI